MIMQKIDPRKVIYKGVRSILDECHILTMFKNGFPLSAALISRL